MCNKCDLIWHDGRYGLETAVASWQCASDLLIIPIAWFGAFWLRFNLDGIPEDALAVAISMLPLIWTIQAFVNSAVGLYRGIWQFASIPDLLRIIKASLVGCAIALIALFLVMRLQGLPRSVIPIYSMLLILLLGGSRFAVRWFKEYKHLMKTGERVLVIGAGRTGEGLVRELLRDVTRNYKPIAFVDDRKSKQGKEIHGIRVVGRCKDIPLVAKMHDIQLIIIAIPSARAIDLRRIMEFCETTGCRVRTLPGLNDLVSGRVAIDLLREISLEDLLGRDPVSLDWEAIRTAISGKKVLVSGGGGSIGSELCRQVARLNPSLLIIVEHSEYNLFTLEQELIEDFPNQKLALHLVDVCDEVAMDNIMASQQPDIIFHAAAYKHVPMLQQQPREAIKNNVLGTKIIAELAVKYGVSKFVLVSSDKAVNPTNIMGASKRVSEMVCHFYNAKGVTRFITVRFGNVLGSAGSVVPIFRKQLEKGGPLTVTHPDMSRFFMTIPEACQLILQALSIGKGGEIFVLDMGEPVKIQFLAEQMIRLAGKKPGIDVEIRYTGIRPGEKLSEELFHSTEICTATSHEKILQAQARSFEFGWFEERLRGFDAACHNFSDGNYNEFDFIAMLQKVVPELETNQIMPEDMQKEGIQNTATVGNEEVSTVV